MKSRHLVFFIALLPVFGFSQSLPSIDFIGGIDYSHRFLSETEPNVLNIPSLAEVRKDEVGKLNWRTGLNYNQPLTNNLYLKTGLRLASIGYKGANNTNVQWPSENSGGTWVPDPALAREVQLIYDYWFLEIPIALRWEFANKKIAPFIELGTAPSLYMTRKTITKTDIGRDVHFGSNEPSGFNKLQFVGLASFGVNYTINDHLQIFGQPTVRYHITNLSKGIIKENLYSAGIELGLRKKLGGKSVDK